MTTTEQMRAHADLREEVQKLREENNFLHEKNIRLDKIAAHETTLAERLEAELSAAQSLLSMQSEALKPIAKYHCAELCDCSRCTAYKALSATAETVAAWKAKEMEPLEKKLAEQQVLLNLCAESENGRCKDGWSVNYNADSSIGTEELTKREAAAKQAGRDEVMKELSEMNPVWYMYRDVFGYWRNFNEAEAGQMVKRGDSWAAFDKMIRRPTYKKG